MLPIWDNKQLGKALNLEIEQEFIANAVSIDSRSIKPGEIFLCLNGERFDGHDFAQQAVAQGAVALICSKAMPQLKVAQIIVADTYQALLALAKYKRANVAAKFIGITGSVGKTSYKETLAKLLQIYGKCYFSSGNFNNHIGLPLCLANLPEDADYAVFELGMNHAGEIEFLTKLVEPDLAVITKIASAHIGNFKDIYGIVAAKAEIFKGLSQNSMVFLNHDDQYYSNLEEIAFQENIRKEQIFTFGQQAEHLQLESINLVKMQAELNFKLFAKAYQLNTSFLNFEALKVLSSVFLVLAKLGLDPELAFQEFAKLESLAGRGKVTIETLPVTGEIQIIDETYNSSLVSTKAALQLLKLIAQAKQSRKVAVLGTMLELGDQALAEHLALKDCLLENKIDQVITVGEYMADLAKTLPKEMHIAHFAEVTGHESEIISKFQAGDVVLLKSSNAIGTKQILEKLRK